MKSKYSNYVMKMAENKKILSGKNEFIALSIDKYFETTKVPLQLSVVSFHLLKFVYALKMKKE